MATNLSAWQVLDCLGESFAVLDRDYRIVWARDPLLAQFKPNAQMVGRFCYEVFFDRESPCPTNCPVSSVFEKGEPYIVERNFVDPQGELRWREARAYPIVNPRGQILYAARISFDITQRKKAQALQEREHEYLERSLEEMSRLQLGEMPFQIPPTPNLTNRENRGTAPVGPGHFQTPDRPRTEHQPQYGQTSRHQYLQLNWA